MRLAAVAELSARACEAPHQAWVATRRLRVLARHVADMLPAGARVADIGCGDGALAAAVARLRPDVAIEGFEVLIRPEARAPITSFDGRRLPVEDGAFDAALLVDVLHHTLAPVELLAEAKRVSRRAIVLKDHLREGWLAGATLRFMDHVGNRRHGVALPCNYLSAAEWDRAFAALGLAVQARRVRLGLYGWPADWLFGRGLHFIARLAW